jgi:hypothetical protein
MNNTERSHLNKIDIDKIDVGIAEDVSYILIPLPHHILEDESSFQPPLEISQTDEYRC